MNPQVITLDGEDASEKLHNALQNITLAAMAAKSDNQVEAIGIGVSAVAGALKGVAAIIGQREGITNESSREEQESTVNSISTLVAALLVAKATKQKRDDNGHRFLAMELNPIIYLAAIKAAENILGQNIDNMLNPGLCGAARDWEKEHGYFGSWEDQTHEYQVTRRGSLH